MTTKPVIIDIMSDEFNDPHWLSLEGRTMGKREDIRAKYREEYLRQRDEISEEKLKSFKDYIK